MNKKRIFIYVSTLIILISLLILSFLPLWNHKADRHYIKINTWKKIQVETGQLHID